MKRIQFMTNFALIVISRVLLLQSIARGINKKGVPISDTPFCKTMSSTCVDCLVLFAFFFFFTKLFKHGEVFERSYIALNLFVGRHFTEQATHDFTATGFW